MNEETRTSRKPTWALAAGLLAAVWVLPPAIHTMRHLCPMRPDGVREAHAVPAFARRYHMACSQCHTDFPLLNSYGRQFMINGYVRNRGQEDSVDNYVQVPDPNSEKLLQNMPIGGLITLTPYSKTKAAIGNTTADDHEYQQTAVDTLALFFSGGNLMGDNLSLWTILEAAHDDFAGKANDGSGGDPHTGFYLRYPEIQAGWHPSQYFNILAGDRSFYLSDPYQNLSNMGNLLNTDRQVVAQDFGTGDALDSGDDANQTLMTYGSVEKEGVGSLYYAAGLSGDQKDDGGAGPKSGHLRLAYDTLQGLEVGAFGSAGRSAGGNAGSNAIFRYARGGVDALGEYAGFTGRAVYMVESDRNLRTTQADDANPDANAGRKSYDRAGYVEALYAFKKDERPWFVPMVRSDWWKLNDDQESYASVGAQLAYFFKENIKATVEYDAMTKQDLNGAAAGSPRKPKGHTWLAQVRLGF